MSKDEEEYFEFQNKEYVWLIKENGIIFVCNGTTKIPLEDWMKKKDAGAKYEGKK